jgi:serine/threonine protein kinase
VRTDLEEIARAVCAQSGYEFIRRVGEGAFKETFEAREGDVVHALKVYRPEAVDQRANREIAAMVQCNHPNIAKLRRVATIDVAPLGRCLYMVEEFLGGGTLARRVAGTPLTTPEVQAMGELLVSAVGHIAANDLVHRDIKLENIMLREDGQTPVIVDFGIVRALGETSLTVTWQAMGPGTPLYAPPEQLCNDKQLIDWRADQFSLGIALALAAFGEHPFSDAPAGNVVEHVAARHAVSRTFVATVNAAGLPTLVRMLAPWPVQRYRTPAELQAAWRAQRGEH